MVLVAIASLGWLTTIATSDAATATAQPIWDASVLADGCSANGRPNPRWTPVNYPSCFLALIATSSATKESIIYAELFIDSAVYGFLTAR